MQNTSLPILDVAAGIVWRDHCFLAACRPAGKPRAGFWEFPGGKFALGETLHQALARELQEELGITPLACELWQCVEHRYPEIHVRLHFVHVRDFAGEPTSREGQELRWVTVEQAMQLPFLPADLALLPELHPPMVRDELCHTEQPLLTSCTCNEKPTQ